MANGQNRPWMRVQDWISLVAGAYLALSTLWVDVGTGGTWTMVIIGLAIVAMAVVALAMPGVYIDEWATAVGGLAAFIAPWVVGFTGTAGAAWTSWIVGAVVVISALAALPASRAVYRQQHHGA